MKRLILTILLMPSVCWSLNTAPDAGLQSIRDLRPVPETRWSLQLTPSFREMERREYEGLFAAPRQETTTIVALDALARYNVSDALQIFAAAPAISSRRQVVSPFSAKTSEAPLSVPSATAGVQWNLPERLGQYVGRGTLQLAWVEGLGSTASDAAVVGYSFMHVTHPLILYGQLQHVRVIDADFRVVEDLQSRQTSSIRFGGAFVANYSTALNASFDVRHRSSERVGPVRLISDLELRVRTGITKAVSEGFTVEPFVEFRVDGALSDVTAGFAAVFNL